MGHIRTFRDPQLSRWQSVVDELVVRRAAAAPAGAAPPGAVELRPDLGHPLCAAAAAVAAETVASGSPAGQTTPAVAEAPSGTFPAVAKDCAARAFALLRAHLERRPRDEIQRLEDALRESVCDPLWAEAVAQYLLRYDVEHLRIPYRPAPADPAQLPPLPLAENATVALVADWATGTAEARRVLEQLRSHQPDVVIHLGDTYYAGTDHECRRHVLELCNDVLGRASRPLPVFTLAGNHDMYAGGAPYYALVDALNRPPLAPAGQLQGRSFFGLRSSGWQLLAMDTGLNDHDVFDVATSMTRLEDSEAAWHRHWIEHAEGRRTILLSHHPLFSAFEPIGNEPGSDRSQNSALVAQFGDRLDAIEAWFWGHEHNLALYGSYLGLRRGRLIGHGAVPVLASQQPYASRVGDKIPVLPPRLDQQDGVFCHGFVILKLDDAARTARVDYYQDSDTRPLVYSETFGG